MRKPPERLGQPIRAHSGRPRTFFALAVLVACVASRVQAQGAARACPAAGDTQSPKSRALNLLKNRTGVPSAQDVDSTATLAAIVAPGDDQHRWDERRAAVVVGFAVDALPGGVESANCHARGLKGRDTHIELVLDSADTGRPRRVIVEVTPRVRAQMAAQGVDWSTQAVQREFVGHWVRVSGWLLFDTDHVKQSANTAPASPDVWRATAWEVHPVTGIEIVPRPPTRP
jgi:hypothetical protein